MLLPLGHEKMTVRRMPVITIALIVVTVAFHVVTTLAMPDAADALEHVASQRFGYVPARANVLGLFTYMFVHADFWHLLGNMWFLFLCGLALEDRWGRAAFGAFYVVAGVAAGGIHHLALSHSTAALIGASGAVAGAMGAFLVLFATTKIRFGGFVGFRVVSFAAPAYVMLPLWAVVEVLYGLMSASSGVAHWAHVGGFALGALVAGAFRVFGVDRRLEDAVERVAVLGDDPRIDTAQLLIAKGEADQAVALLEGLALEKPDSVHVQDALREARRVSSSPDGGVPSTRSSVRPSSGSVRPSSGSVRPSSGSVRPSSGSVRPASIPPAPAVPSFASASAVAVAEPEVTPFFPPPPPKRDAV